MTQSVALGIDEQAMRRTLRYAFANHDTAVQELIQNARRAGASKVEITYDPDTLELFVADDGCGIEDFSALMRAGGSGWDSNVAAAEKPYGLGFLSAIYAADQVAVESKGQCLAFRTEDAIDYGRFALVDVPASAGTTICLRGFKWKNPSEAIRRMAAGYPLPITFNGEDIARPDAVTGDWVVTPVGRIRLVSGLYDNIDSSRIYLQGFLVKEPHRTWPSAIVHLDSARFLGKLPDRNVVIDEAHMLQVVNEVIRGLYEQRLQDLRNTLEPGAFCEQAYDLARSLRKLDIFNDIDVVPRSWLRSIDQLPHDSFERLDYLGDIPEGPAITRSEVESGQWPICNLYSYDAYAGLENLHWLYAWKAGYRHLDQYLDERHWLLQSLAIRADTEVSFRVVGPGKQGYTPSRTAIVCAAVQVCECVELEADGRTVRIEESVAITDDSAEATIYVMRNGDVYALPTSETIQQVSPYLGENDMWLDDELHRDTQIVREGVCELIAESPEARVAMALTAAIRDFNLRGIQCHIAIDATGSVTVSALSEAAAAEG